MTSKLVIALAIAGATTVVAPGFSWASPLSASVQLGTAAASTAEKAYYGYGYGYRPYYRHHYYRPRYYGGYGYGGGYGGY